MSKKWRKYPRVCKQCGKEFLARKRYNRPVWGIYCSNACRIKGVSGKWAICPQCGERYWLQKSRERYYDRTFCSSPCYKRFVKLSAKRRSVKHKLRRWRDEVLLRDNYRCVECGETDVFLLQAHHIMAVNEKEDLMFEVWNGETLCILCHADKHSDNSQVFGMLQSQYKNRVQG